jgi:hypothetical protein
MVAFVFFYIRFGFRLLKEKNLLRKREIGLGTRISLLPRQEKNKIKPRLRRTIWWPPSHPTLNCEGRLGDHQIIIFFVPHNPLHQIT